MCHSRAQVDSTRRILVVFTGLPATGKSSVAARLLAKRGGLHLSTDETRERLFPRAEVGAEVKYGHEASRLTYAEVEGQASSALVAGTPLVILDGTYLRAADRRRAVTLGVQAGAEVLVLELWAAEATVLARLAARTPGVEHHSEADLEVYRSFRAKLDRGEDDYLRPNAAELAPWADEPVVGVTLETDTGAMAQFFGTPSPELRELLSGLAG